MRSLALLLAAAGTVSLGACATRPEPEPEPVVRVQYVDRPVAVPCVDERVGGPPVYTDSDDALRAAPDAAERYRLVSLGRIERTARLEILEAALSVCRE